MAVIYAENSCNLSDVNAFYRVEAYNLGVFSTVSVSLGSLQTVPVTFANAGNFRGVLLSLFTTAATTNRGVAVAFQENVSGTWTTIETITLTADQIHASSNKLALATFVPFRFTPYTVTNAANKYRFTMIHSGGTTGTWYTRTSNGTAPFYAVWADNALSFTDNDCVIAEGKVTINQTATFRGVLGTGDTTRSVCAICVRDSNPTIDNAPTFLIPNPASPITLTIDGCFVWGAHSGLRVGTVATPIPAGSPRVTLITKFTPTYGTIGGFTDVIHSGSSGTASACRKMTLLMYGEIPTVERTTLADDALASQGTIITTDDTGWQIGDQVQVGKQYSSATINTTLHTIQSISGTTIVLTPNLSTATRKAGGAVIRMNGYGIVYKSDNDSNIVGYFRSPSHLFIQGVQFLATVLNHGNSGGYATCEDVGLRSKHTVRNCSAQFVTASNIFAQTTPPEDGIDFLNLNFFRSGLGTLYVGSTASQGRSGAYKFDNNVVIGSAVLSSIASAAKLNIIVTNNVFENGSGAFFINAVNPTITGNKFWGSSVTTGHLRIGVLVGGTIKNNTFNKNIVAVGLDPAPTIGVTLKDFVFGDETANTDDIQFSPDAYVDVTLESPTGVPVISETYLPETVDGSMLKVTDTNNVENVDTVYLTYGKYYRTGYGLADTTVWTGQAFGVASVGQFGLCLESKDPTNLLKYQDNNPKETTIGNCQNLNVSVVARIKINNAAFYAGTHTKPTLRVTYDDGTEITSVAQATTDDQLLSVNFSPTTAKESIKIELEMATDAITTDAYVYLGKLAVAKAEGVMIDTTTMSKWSAGLPLGTLRTFQSPESPLDALLVNHQIAGSVGKQLKDGLTEDNFLALK